MKQSSLIIFLFFVCSSSFAGTGNKWMAREFTVKSDTLNSTLPSYQSKFVFHAVNAAHNNGESITLKTSTNGFWRDISLDETGSFSIVVEPGTYSFQFLYNTDYTEIQRGGVTASAQHEITVDLYFIRTPQIQVYKPVIYFHTDTEREFDLSVQPVGNFTFVYPEMNGSWKGVANPNGDLTINGTVYPYLFWESSQQYRFHSEGNGFKIAKNEIVSFLEKKLTELGLNQKEKTDFITFWGPKLAQNETSFVQFSVDESCDQFAVLSCNPRPESVHRVYIQFAAWDSYFEAFLNDVTFPAVEQGKWSLLEWGGFSFTLPEQLTQY